MRKYIEYFNIDPQYFPVVNADLIEKDPDLWKKFFPHKTFVELIEDCIGVISKQTRASLWVEGAYGTGKSHAVLTLKKLLEASLDETKNYFERFPNELSQDLYNKLINVKTSGKILTVHKYGSSSIRSDNDLVTVIQESILKALKENGYDTVAFGGLKQSILKWLEKERNVKFLDENLTDINYSSFFDGDNAENIIKKLNTYTGDDLNMLVSKIAEFGKTIGITVFSLDVDGLIDWIKDIIEKCNLKAIVFIWDEFTEYFKNNMRSLTGFQHIVELSQNNPFYFIIVTHNVSNFIDEKNGDVRRIKDRFKPTRVISLPDNIAFQLLNNALTKKQDPQILREWETCLDVLSSRTVNSRMLTCQQTGLNDKELIGILPIHPYAAMLLKHISEVFISNQRSMFEFIKDEGNENTQGFKWFIKNYGPEDDNLYVTVDMLWNTFYEKGKQNLSSSIRAILDVYDINKDSLIEEEQKVLKAILLLEAISQQTNYLVNMLIPNKNNLNNAFEGTELENNESVNIAEGLKLKGIIFEKNIHSKGSFYAALTNNNDLMELEKTKDKIRVGLKTKDLLSLGSLDKEFELTPLLKLRYKIIPVVESEMFVQIKSQSCKNDNRILVLLCVARNESESNKIYNNIEKIRNDNNNVGIIIDASNNILSDKEMEEYIESMAQAEICQKSDRSQSYHYSSHAADIIKNWIRQIKNGEFKLYSLATNYLQTYHSFSEVLDSLKQIDKSIYPKALEHIREVNDPLWSTSNLALGVKCGIKQNTEGLFKSKQDATKLELFIGEKIWKIVNYQKANPTNIISEYKNIIDSNIEKSFKESGKISLSEIYEPLKEKPYGFMPCNLTAFVLGFLLKDYTNGKYYWSNGSVTNTLNEDKLSTAINNLLKHENLNSAYTPEYIVQMTDDERSFNENSSIIFKQPKGTCLTIENTRMAVRKAILNLEFPLWCLKYAKSNINQKDKVNEIIDLYVSLMNSDNYTQNANAIGKKLRENVELVNNLKELITCDNCQNGMNEYLKSYQGGILINLANEVGDSYKYINNLKEKINSVESANWLWYQETTNSKIDEEILEYKIILASNKYQHKADDYKSCLSEWIDRIKHIYISYLFAQDDWESMNKLVENLYYLKKNGEIKNNKDFLEQIEKYGNEFNEFYSNQIVKFKKVCGYFLNDLSDDNINAIFNELCKNNDLFTLEKSDYQKRVKNIITEFTEKQAQNKIKMFWKERTGTDNPEKWSEINSMPIICMVPTSEFDKARQAFNIILGNNTDKNTTEIALKYLENASFMDNLSNKELMNKAFRKTFTKNYDVLIEDISDLKKEIINRVSIKPYDWIGRLEIDEIIKNYANDKYNESGVENALECINGMDINEVKKYLQKLIKNNINVGIEILKNRE